MYRVNQVAFVEGTVAVALEHDRAGPVLAVGSELIAGTRRWKVTQVTETGVSGQVAAKLEGPSVTIGLVLRLSTESMGLYELEGAARLLVRLARAFRAIDLEGVVKWYESISDVPITPDAIAVVKTALFAKLLVNGGATKEELDEAAKALGINDEL